MSSRTFTLSIASAAIAGLLFGFDTAVVSGVTGDIRDQFSLTPAALGLTVSSALWGTLLGALCAGSIGQRAGSRTALRYTAILFAASALGCAFAAGWGALIGFRALGGVAIGATSVLAPVYLAEISPPHRRGLLVGLFQFNIVLGILVAYSSNYLLGRLNFEDELWRWKFGVMVVPALAFLAMLLRIPESPRWLALNGQDSAAMDALVRLGSPEPHKDLQALSKATDASSVRATLSWRRHRHPIVLALALAAFNQLTGINAVLYYLNDIFAAAGFGDVSSDMQAVIVGATNLIFTMAGMACIDRIGRRQLLMIGAAGMAICLSLVAEIMAGYAGASLLIWALAGFIACFAFSQGAVIWVYLSEIFPTAVRARGQSLGSSAHWLLNAMLSMAFPVVAAYSTAAPFAFFAAVMVVQVIVVWRWFPETRGRSLEDLQCLVSGNATEHARSRASFTDKGE